MTDRRIFLTDHAIRRYQQRHHPKATIEDIERAVANGRFQHDRPAGISLSTGSLRADAYIVSGVAVFVLQLKERGYLAVTCLKRPSLAKADRRALREWAREEGEWGFAA